jgi:hypothetical protein
MQKGFVTKRKFYFADVDAFVEPLCVVPDVGSNPKCKYFQVKPRRQWGEDFASWIMEPHYNDVTDVDDDEMEDESEVSEEEDSTVAETDSNADTGSEEDENSELEDDDSEEESDSE